MRGPRGSAGATLASVAPSQLQRVRMALGEQAAHASAANAALACMAALLDSMEAL